MTSPSLFAAQCLLVVPGLALAAQDPAPTAERPLRDAKAVAAALAETDPTALAWAAHDATRLGDPSLIAPLRKALLANAEAKATTDRYARALVLDALALLDAQLPSTDLLPFVAEDLGGNTAFLLLARAPQRNEAELFAMFRDLWPQPPPEQQARFPDREQLRLRTHALGNLLAAQRTPGFAALLVEHTDLDLRATVTSPNAGFASHSSSDRVTFLTRFTADANLPPLPSYRLVDGAAANAICEELAAGPVAVGITRRTFPAGKTLTLPRTTRANEASTIDALPWLGGFLGRTIDPPLRVSIRFQGAEQYLVDLGKARQRLQDFRTQLLQDLVAARALGEVDAARLTQVQVQVAVDDRRGDRSTPLPELPAAR